MRREYQRFCQALAKRHCKYHGFGLPAISKLRRGSSNKQQHHQQQQQQEEEEEQHRRRAKPYNIAETSWALGSRAIAIHMLRHLQPILGLQNVILGLYVYHVAPSWGWHASIPSMFSRRPGVGRRWRNVSGSS